MGIRMGLVPASAGPQGVSPVGATTGPCSPDPPVAHRRQAVPFESTTLPISMFAWFGYRMMIAFGYCSFPLNVPLLSLLLGLSLSLMIIKTAAGTRRRMHIRDIVLPNPLFGAATLRCPCLPASGMGCLITYLGYSGVDPCGEKSRLAGSPTPVPDTVVV